jgi:predicted nucleic acid-binding protein
MDALYLDSSVFIAYLSKQHFLHDQSVNVVIRLLEQSIPLYTSVPTCSEVITTLASQSEDLQKPDGQKRIVQLLSEVCSKLNVTFIESNNPYILSKMFSLQEEYRIGGRTALHTCIMMEHQIKTVITFDPDFSPLFVTHVIDRYI